MERIRNKKYLGFVFFGLFEILLGVVQHRKIIPSSGATTPGIPNIVAGLFIFAIGLYLSRKPEIEAMPDERTRKRDMKVFTGAFGIVFHIRNIFNADRRALGGKNIKSWRIFLIPAPPFGHYSDIPKIHVNNFCSDNFVGCAHSIL